MKSIKSLFACVALASLFAFGAGCGDNVVKDLEKMADEACACKDAACAEKVLEKLKKYGENAKEPSGDDKAKAEKALQRIMECTTKAAMGGAMGGDTPAAAGDEPAAAGDEPAPAGDEPAADGEEEPAAE